MPVTQNKIWLALQRVSTLVSTFFYWWEIDSCTWYKRAKVAQVVYLGYFYIVTWVFIDFITKLREGVSYPNELEVGEVWRAFLGQTLRLFNVCMRLKRQRYSGTQNIATWFKE